jgi:hypothetical protein
MCNCKHIVLVLWAMAAWCFIMGTNLFTVGSGIVAIFLGLHLWFESESINEDELL